MRKGILFVTILVLLNACDNKKSFDILDTKSIPTDAQKEQIKQIIGGRLKDNLSARYTWPAYSDESPGWYCGYVNSKNSFGAYVGNEVFIASFDINTGNITGVHFGSETPSTVPILCKGLLK